jgi:hypothetical protein
MAVNGIPMTARPVEALTEEEARAELQTLFSDPAEVEKWLAQMPLRKGVEA